MHSFRNLFLSQRAQLVGRNLSKRKCSTSLVPVSEFIEKSNHLFSQEQKKQLEEVGRVEKIAIEVSGPPEDMVLMMNQDISTPYDCCRHISLPLSQQTPLALVNDKVLWDMHRPLPGNCALKFLNFKDPDPYSLNQVFWRTGSLILGAIITKSFKDDVSVLLHSFPFPMVKSGSFVYDAILSLPEWEPNEAELRILSAEFLTFVNKNLPIERLSVSRSLAMDIFEGNKYKVEHVKKMAAAADDHKVTLYRVGDFIDASVGPMVGNTSFFGRCSVTAVHRIQTNFQFYRFQGVALPKGIMLNHAAFDIIQNRGTTLNEAALPTATGDRIEHDSGTSTSRTQLPRTPGHIDLL